METTKIISNIFSKNGNLSAPTSFQNGGYSWKVELTFSEKLNVPAIDLKVECSGIEDDKCLFRMLEFRNGMKTITQKYYHNFDRERSTFCFRRIVTGVRHSASNGETIASFPIDRFMKYHEIGEHYDSIGQTKWPFYAPVTWKVLEDGRVSAKSIKPCYNRFEFCLTLTNLDTTTNKGFTRFPKWPKSETYPVQLNFFLPVWPELETLLSTFDFDERKAFILFDILGAHYHSWKFDEDKLLELNEIAIHLGFYKFMDGIGLEGDYFRNISSPSTSDIVKNIAMELAIPQNSLLRHEKRWNVKRIPKENSDSPTIFKIFINNSLQLNVNFFESKLHESNYFSVGAALVGDLENDKYYKCKMQISLGTGSKAIIAKATRHLSKVQNTICIPVVCSVEKLEELRLNQGIVVNFVFEIVTDPFEEMSGRIEMPGQNNVLLDFDGKKIAVNKDFLANHTKFFAAMFFNDNFEEHRKDVIEMNYVKFEEMCHFLDSLYHGTKLFDVSQYYHVLRMADEWLCEKVTKIVEKALNNCKLKSINKDKLFKKFNLKLSSTNTGLLKRRSSSLETCTKAKNICTENK